MYKSLLANYIKNLKEEHIRNYISKNYRNLNISDNEIKIIYDYIMNKWEKIYDEDPKILEELKSKLSKDVYEEIMKLLKTAYKFKNR